MKSLIVSYLRPNVTLNGRIIPIRPSFLVTRRLRSTTDAYTSGQDAVLKSRVSEVVLLRWTVRGRF